MKTALTTSLFVITALGLLGAKDEKVPAIPKEKEGRWGIYSYAEAKAEAAKKKRPIAYIVQDDRAKDEEKSEREATDRAFWGLSKECTMMVIPARLIAEAKNRCGDAVYAALTSKELGKTAPKIAIMDQVGEKVLGYMDKDTIIGADEKSLKAFAKQMEEYNKDPSLVPAIAAAPEAPPAPAAAATPAAAAPATAAATPPAAAPPVADGPVAIKDGKPEAWTSAAGSTIQATLLEVDGDSATLLLADGRKLPVPVSSLSPDSQKRVEALKTASAK